MWRGLAPCCRCLLLLLCFSCAVVVVVVVDFGSASLRFVVRLPVYVNWPVHLLLLLLLLWSVVVICCLPPPIACSTFHLQLALPLRISRDSYLFVAFKLFISIALFFVFLRFSLSLSSCFAQFFIVCFL